MNTSGLNETLTETGRRAILDRLKERGFTLSGWCRANGFKLRTAQGFFYYGIGMKEGGEKINSILAALKQQGLLQEPQA